MLTCCLSLLGLGFGERPRWGSWLGIPPEAAVGCQRGRGVGRLGQARPGGAVSEAALSSGSLLTAGQLSAGPLGGPLSLLLTSRRERNQSRQGGGDIAFVM